MNIHLSEETLRWLIGGGVTSVVALVGTAVRELRQLNRTISKIVLREVQRDKDVKRIGEIVSSLPCVASGFQCPSHNEGVPEDEYV